MACLYSMGTCFLLYLQMENQTKGRGTQGVGAGRGVSLGRGGGGAWNTVIQWAWLHVKAFTGVAGGRPLRCHKGGEGRSATMEGGAITMRKLVTTERVEVSRGVGVGVAVGVGSRTTRRTDDGAGGEAQDWIIYCCLA